MAVKAYVPQTGDVTDAMVGPPDTDSDVMERAEASGMDVDGAVNDYRTALRHLTSHSVDFHGLKVPRGRGPKLYGRWRWVDGKWTPADAAAKCCARELGVEEIAA